MGVSLSSFILSKSIHKSQNTRFGRIHKGQVDK